MRVGRPGARRIDRAVSVARAGEPALRANDPYRSLPLHFRGLTLLTRASWRLNFAYLGPLWRAPYDLRAQKLTALTIDYGERAGASRPGSREESRWTRDWRPGARRMGFGVRAPTVPIESGRLAGLATLPAAEHSAGAFLFGWLHREVRLLPCLASLCRSIRACISQMPVGCSPPVVHCSCSVARGHLRTRNCRSASMCGPFC